MPASTQSRGGSPRLSRTHVLTFRLQPRGRPEQRFQSPTPTCPVYFRLRPLLAGSPPCPRRIAFVIPRTASSPPAALHPASRQRSCLQLRGHGLPRHGLSPCYVCAFASAPGARSARRRRRTRRRWRPAWASRNLTWTFCCARTPARREVPRCLCWISCPHSGGRMSISIRQV